MICVACHGDIPAGNEYVEISETEQCHKRLWCLTQIFELPKPFQYKRIAPSCKGCGEDIEEGAQVVLLLPDFDDDGLEFYCHMDLDCLVEALGAEISIWEEEEYIDRSDKHFEEEGCSDITEEEFDQILLEIIREMTPEELLSYGDVYNVLAEEMNNEVLNRWKKKKNEEEEAQDV